MCADVSEDTSADASADIFDQSFVFFNMFLTVPKYSITFYDVLECYRMF